jgi:hypothetical protein
LNVAGEIAGLVMTTIASLSPSQLAASRGDAPGLISEIREFCQQFVLRAFDPYRPELHYMRGPGPACRARHIAS